MAKAALFGVVVSTSWALVIGGTCKASSPSNQCGRCSYESQCGNRGLGIYCMASRDPACSSPAPAPAPPSSSGGICKASSSSNQCGRCSYESQCGNLGLGIYCMASRDPACSSPAPAPAPPSSSGGTCKASSPSNQCGRCSYESQCGNRGLGIYCMASRDPACSSAPGPAPSPSSGGTCQIYTGTQGLKEKTLVDAAKRDGMSGPELAQFMAQCAHECAGFTTMVEYSSGSQYEGRRDLGNIYRGDGVRYKGRGYIQITGRSNYHIFGDYVHQDLEGNPTLASQPAIAAQIALQYWNHRVKPRVSNFYETTTVTRLINGGTNGLVDRKAKFNQYLKTCVVSSGGINLALGNLEGASRTPADGTCAAPVVLALLFAGVLVAKLVPVWQRRLQPNAVVAPLLG